MNVGLGRHHFWCRFDRRHFCVELGLSERLDGASRLLDVALAALNRCRRDDLSNSLTHRSIQSGRLHARLGRASRRNDLHLCAISCLCTRKVSQSARVTATRGGIRSKTLNLHWHQTSVAEQIINCQCTHRVVDELAGACRRRSTSDGAHFALKDLRELLSGNRNGNPPDESDNANCRIFLSGQQWTSSKLFVRTM